jgi:hypothetical protein
MSSIVFNGQWVACAYTIAEALQMARVYLNYPTGSIYVRTPGGRKIIVRA